MTARAALFPAALAAFLLGGTASAEVWIGGGAPEKWDDAANWSEGRPAVPTPGVDVLFDSATAANPGLGAKNTAAFRSISLATNSANVNLRAGAFMFGGQINSEPEIGWIAENVVMPGLIRNDSASELVFSAPVSCGASLSLFPENGPLVFARGLNSFEHKVETAGAGGLRFSGGSSTLSNFTWKSGPLRVEGKASLCVKSPYLGTWKSDSDAFVASGATLEWLNGPDDRIGVRVPLVLEAGSKSRHATFIGPGTNNNNHTTFCVIPEIGENAELLRMGWLHWSAPSSETNKTSFVIPQGVHIEANGITWCGRRRISWEQEPPIEFVKCDILGPEFQPGAKEPPKDATLLEALRGSIAVGGTADDSRASRITVKTKGVVEFRAPAGNLSVPGGEGDSRNNKLILSPGATFDVRGIYVGDSGASNVVQFLGVRGVVGNSGIFVGTGKEKNGDNRSNLLVLDDASEITSQGRLSLALPNFDERYRNFASDNVVRILGGSFLSTAGAIVGGSSGKQGDRSGPPSTGNKVVVSGNGSSWDLGGRDIDIGWANGWAQANDDSVTVKDGAVISNVLSVAIGRSQYSPTKNNKFLVQGGSVFSTGPVRVGMTGSSNDRWLVSSSNSLVVVGTKKHPALWDFGGGDLYIGGWGGINEPLRDNVASFEPGARIRGIKTLSVGGLRDSPKCEGNVLRLAGGDVAPVENLVLLPGNTIEISVDPSFGKHSVKPLGVSGDFKMGSETHWGDAWILPVAAKGVKPGTYPVLQWKGQGVNLKALKLSPAADAAHWSLSVDPEKKLVSVIYR